MSDRQQSRDDGHGAVRQPMPQESVVQRIGRLYGAKTRVMLHDSPSESGPLLPQAKGEDVLESDSQYQILGQIATGGVGVVYKAHDKNLGREVALKVLRADRITVKHVAERLVEEAQVGGQLQHPGIVPVYGLGIQKDGRPQFAMKLIKGATFAELLQERRDPSDNLAKFLDQFEQLCHAMAYCHARGVIHRDLKPANIMVGSFGEVLVVDWGFGKVLGIDHRGRSKSPAETTPNPASVIATLRSDATGTQSIAGSIMGTPSYMPPEQALGQVDELDERADVFALGAVLCEVLTGAPPYVGSASDVLVMAAQGRLEDALKQLDECDADPALVELAKECLAPMRQDRPAHAGVVAERIHGHFSALEQRARRAKVEAAKAHARAQEQKARLAAEQLKAEQERAKASKARIKSERALAAAEEQRRLSLWERQRSRRTLILASAVLLALVVGGVTITAISSSADRRAAEREEAYSQAVREAMELASQQRWSEAAIAAEGSLAVIPPDEIGRRDFVEQRILEWRTKQEQEEATAAQRARDLEASRRLRELRARTAGEYNPGDIDAEYASALREYGIDVKDSAKAAAAIRRSSIRTELVSAFDSWADVRRYNPALQDRDWRRLVEIAQHADPDPVRTRIRTEDANGGVVALAHLASSSEIENQPPTTLVRLARALGRLGDPAGAVRLLRQARARHPDDVWVNLDLAGALGALQPPRHREAARYLRSALALLPESNALRWRLAATFAAAGEWDAVAASMRVLLAKTPDDPRLHAGLTDALTRLGRLEEAQRAGERLVELSPEDHASWTWLLRALARRADASALLDAAGRAVQRFAGSPVALAYRAVALERLGKPGEAMESLDAALQSNPQDPIACVIGAELHRRRGHPTRAVRLLQPLAKRIPSVEVETAFVRALRDTGELDRTARTLANRFNANPRDVGALWGLCDVLAMQFNFGDELRLRRLIAHHAPYDAEAHAEIGRVLRDRLGRLAAAADAYRQALALEPETGTHHAALGLALARLDRTEEALTACRHARQLAPHDFSVRTALVRVMLRAGRQDEARAVAQAAADEAPPVCVELQAAGEALLLVGDLERAEATLARAHELGPESGPVQLALARTRFRRDDPAGAEEVLAEATKNRPRDVAAWLALAEVQAATGRPAEAVESYRRAQRLARRHASGYAGEAWVRGRSETAEPGLVRELARLAQRAVGLDPGDGPSWRAQALVLLLDKDLTGAANACAKGLTTGVDDGLAADLHFLAAMANARKRRLDEARRSYESGVARLRASDGPKGDREALRAEAEALLQEDGG